VVLLNADTLVVNNWLDRLRQLAYLNKNIATVTPFSNNAEKFSYPHPLKNNDLPDIETIENLDKIAANVNQDQAIEVPTGNGFCLFIKRACLNQIGHFNQTYLLRGYGEESEFCLRASKKGWTHYCATDVYVGHQGGQSFQQERAHLVYLNNERIKQKYPFYSKAINTFIADDPLKVARKRIEQASLNQLNCDQLHVADYSINRHPLFKAQLRSSVLAGHSVWILSIAYQNRQTQFQLYAVDQGQTNLTYHSLSEFNQLIHDLQRLKPTQITVHHSRYFPHSLNKVLVKFANLVNVRPYDITLRQQFSILSWTDLIVNIELMTDYSIDQYQYYPNKQRIKLPRYFTEVSCKRPYLPYIAIFSDIIHAAQLQLLYAIVEDWLANHLPLSFIIVGHSNFQYQLESSQKIIFASLTIEKTAELKKLCSHVFILPNTSEFISADLTWALQANFQLITLSQPNTEEILLSQLTAITIESTDNPIKEITKTFRHYAKKLG
jgi:hypothetical protein